MHASRLKPKNSSKCIDGVKLNNLLSLLDSFAARLKDCRGVDNSIVDNIKETLEQECYFRSKRYGDMLAEESCILPSPLKDHDESKPVTVLADETSSSEEDEATSMSNEVHQDLIDEEGFSIRTARSTSKW